MHSEQKDEERCQLSSVRKLQNPGKDSAQYEQKVVLQRMDPIQETNKLGYKCITLLSASRK